VYGVGLETVTGLEVERISICSEAVTGLSVDHCTHSLSGLGLASEAAVAISTSVIVIRVPMLNF
jgi:hypothetical protein